MDCDCSNLGFGALLVLPLECKTILRIKLSRRQATPRPEPEKPP